MPAIIRHWRVALARLLGEITDTTEPRDFRLHLIDSGDTRCHRWRVDKRATCHGAR